MKKTFWTILGLFAVAYIILVIKNNQEPNKSITVQQLSSNYNPAHTGKSVKMAIKSNTTYAQIGNKQYKVSDMDPNMINQANEFGRKVLQGMESGIIKTKRNPTQKELDMAEEAVVIYGYTNPDFQIPIQYCDKYYKIPNYRKAFIEKFGAKNTKARNILVELFGVSGFEYLVKELNAFQSNAVLAEGIKLMDENYEDFKVEVAKYGLKNPTRVTFCQSINDMPEMVLEQQWEVFRIQHQNF